MHLFTHNPHSPPRPLPKHSPELKTSGVFRQLMLYFDTVLFCLYWRLQGYIMCVLHHHYTTDQAGPLCSKIWHGSINWQNTSASAETWVGLDGLLLFCRYLGASLSLSPSLSLSLSFLTQNTCTSLKTGQVWESNDSLTFLAQHLGVGPISCIIISIIHGRVNNGIS